MTRIVLEVRVISHAGRHLRAGGDEPQEGRELIKRVPPTDDLHANAIVADDDRSLGHADDQLRTVIRRDLG